MSDPLERAIERGTQRRLLSENANLRALLAQAEAREADNERVIVGLNKQLTEQFELSTKYVGISEECRAALSTARAELEISREAGIMLQRALLAQTSEIDTARAERDAAREAHEETAEKLNGYIRALAQAEAREAEDRKEFEIVRKASRLFEQATHNWQDRALKAEVTLYTARAEAEAMREALKKAKQFVYVNGQGPEDQELLNCLEAALQAHRPHGEDK